MKARFIPLAALLASDRPDHHCIAIRNGEPLSFAHFRAAVASTANLIRRGGHVRCGLLAEDSFSFAIGLFGALHAGAKVILPPNASPATLDALSARWDVLLTDRAIGPKGIPITEVPDGATDLAPLDSAAAYIDFFTSGSSSAPKLIPRRLAELDCEIAMIEGLWGARVSEVCVQATVSHQHIYGLTFKLLWSLAAGRPFAAETHEIWESLLPILEPDGLLVSSPAHLSRLGGFAPAAARPGLVLTAGAPLSHAAAGQARETLHRLPDEIYGSTETGVIATRVQATADPLWAPFPGCAIRQAEDGRLVLRSPWAGAQDWLVMDDIVSLDGKGGFRLLGRGDRVVKIEGKRVSLPAVEEALTSLPEVTEAAVVALSGARDQLGAIVVLSDLGRETLARLGAFRFGRALQRALAPTLEPMARPRRWRFVECLPTSGMGKRSAAELAAMFEG